MKIEKNEERNIERNIEKDKLIKTQSEQIERFRKEAENQNKHQIKQIESQNKQIESLKKEVANQVIENGNQRKQIEKLEQCPHRCETIMIIPNVEKDNNFAPFSTAFQWKFQPNEIRAKSATRFYSPPFYNVQNSNCFHIRVFYEHNSLSIGLGRYRGKYDHPINSITKTRKFVFKTKIFGKNGKQVYNEFVENKHFIPYKKMVSDEALYFEINNGEIDSLTIDGYVHLFCSFE